MLRHVARFAPQHRLLLLGTYRDVELDAQHPLTDALGALYRETTCERILLKGLDAPEVAQLVADSDVLPDKRDELARTVCAVTNGNPFFVREVLQSLFEERQRAPKSDGRSGTAGDQLSIPDSVRQVLGRRVRRLAAETGRLLSVAAAFGGPFHLGVAGQVAGLDEPTALHAIDDALRAQLVRPADSAERYDFTHALIRETLYSELSPSRQARLHRQVAEAMEQILGGDIAVHAREIAQQYHRSKDLSGAERGATYALTAADQASKGAAHDEVVTFTRMALDILQRDDGRRPGALCQLATALTWSLRFEEALAAAREAADLLAALRGEDAAADFLAEAAWSMAGAGSPRGAWALAAHGLRLTHDRRDATWIRLMVHEIARREAEDPNNPGIPVDSPERREVSDAAANLRFTASERLMLAANGFLLPRSREEARARYRNDPWGYNHRHDLTLWQERVAECEQQGRIADTVMNLAYLSRIYAQVGDIPAARTALEKSRTLAIRIVTPSLQLLILGAAEYEFRVVLDEGFEDLLERDNLPQPAPENSWSFAAIQAGAARIFARLGRTEVSLGLLKATLSCVQTVPGWMPNYPMVICDGAEALWLLERTDDIEIIERNLREKVLRPDLRYPMRDSRRSLAHLCALLGRYDEAIELFHEARTVLDEEGARPLRAIVDHDEALMYLRRGKPGDVERAAPLLDAALRQFRALGMPGWVRRAEALQTAPAALAHGGAHDRQRIHTLAEEVVATAREFEIPLLIERVEVPSRGEHSPIENRQDTQPAESVPRIPQSTIAAVFRRDGDYWTVAHAETVVRLKDSKGLQYLAHLLRHPGQEVLAIDLVQSLENGDPGSRMGERTSEPIRATRSPTPALDAPAKAAYKRRLEALRDELSEAEANNDIGRTEEARSEMDMLADQLRGALGLGGRDRPVANDLERARSAVGKRIRVEIKRIRAAHLSLGRHLAATVTTGYFCAYEPGRDAPVHWEL